MNIITYNLRLGGRADHRVHWQQIFEATTPDIFLVQETCNPQLYLTAAEWTTYRKQIYWLPVGNLRWGSAIFVRQGRVKPIAMPIHSGYVVGVEVRGFNWPEVSPRRLQVYSVHIPAPYKRPANEVLDFILTRANADPRADFIIGGDFNVTTGVRHPSEKRQAHDLWLLERLRKQFNLMNCWQIANPNRDLPQTLRWGRDQTEPYHCDAIFAPAAWYRHLDACEVLTAAPWNTLSDHHPVLAKFDTSGTVGQ